MTPSQVKGSSAPSAEPMPDEVIELAQALEQKRGLRIVADVAALSAGYHEGPFRAGYESACEEMTHRLRTEVWELCLPPVGATDRAAATQGAPSKIAGPDASLEQVMDAVADMHAIELLDNAAYLKDVRGDGTVEGYSVETYYLPCKGIGDDAGFLRVVIDDNATDAETRGQHSALIAAGWVKAQGAPTPAPEPVAVRYRTGKGNVWRYLNYPFTKGWEFPASLGTLVYLYDRAAGIQPTPAQGEAK